VRVLTGPRGGPRRSQNQQQVVIYSHLIFPVSGPYRKGRQGMFSPAQHKEDRERRSNAFCTLKPLPARCVFLEGSKDKGKQKNLRR
jgi:hypothetical protein